MGFKNGQMVHYRSSNTCFPLVITDDQAPNYDQDVTGIQFAPGPLNEGAALTLRVDIEHDSIVEVEGNLMAEFNEGTWHNQGECRDMYGQE